MLHQNPRNREIDQPCARSSDFPGFLYPELVGNRKINFPHMCRLQQAMLVQEMQANRLLLRLGHPLVLLVVTSGELGVSWDTLDCIFYWAPHYACFELCRWGLASSCGSAAPVGEI